MAAGVWFILCKNFKWPKTGLESCLYYLPAMWSGEVRLLC